MSKNDYTNVKEAIGAISQSNLIYWGSSGLACDDNLERDYPFIDFDVLMMVAKSNFYPPEDYYPQDCSVRHAFELSLFDYCKQMHIGVVCSSCGKTDNHENDIEEFHRQTGTFIDRWGQVEVALRTLEMMRHDDGTFSTRHYGGQTAKAKRRKFEKRRDLLFPQMQFPWFWQQLKDWAEFRNGLVHNVLVRECDGNYKIVHFDEIARRRSQHTKNCSAPSEMNNMPVIPVINVESVKGMSARMSHVLRSFNSLISTISESGTCSNFKINRIWEDETVRISVAHSSDHAADEDLVIWYDHDTHHRVEEGPWMTAV